MREDSVSGVEDGLSRGGVDYRFGTRFRLPLFCLVCQKMIGEGIRGVLAEEVKDDKKGRNWHQLLARAHEDRW